MAKSEFKVIKQASLTNNCPECYNQDLSLTFFQKHICGPFYHRTTGELKRELKCNTCKSLLYPVSWTEDIERSVEYYEKAVQPEKTAIRFRPLFYILVLLGVVMAGAFIYLYLQGVIEF
jgi:hypothetical protein